MTVFMWCEGCGPSGLSGVPTTPTQTPRIQQSRADSEVTPWSPKRVCLPVDRMVHTATTAEAHSPHIQSANGGFPSPLRTRAPGAVSGGRRPGVTRLQETH